VFQDLKLHLPVSLDDLEDDPFENMHPKVEKSIKIESKNDTPNASIPPLPKVSEKIPLNTLFLGWCQGVPEKVNKQERLVFMQDLFLILKEGGFTPDDLEFTFKKKVCAKFLPVSKPKSMSQDDFNSWKLKVEADYDSSLAYMVESKEATFDIDKAFTGNGMCTEDDLNDVDFYKSQKSGLTPQRPYLFSDEVDPEYDEKDWQRKLAFVKKNGLNSVKKERGC